MANQKIVKGVESIQLAVIDDNGITGPWVKIENIAPGTVNYTSNEDTKTPIIPEDKDVAIIVLSTPGDADVFNFGLLELSHENFAMLFNVDQDLATSTTTVLAQRKQATLAIKLTTRPVNGVKKIFHYPNTSATSTYLNNFTKDALVQIAVAADILAYQTIDGKDAIYTMQTVKADGSVINSVPPTVSAGTDQNLTAATGTLTGTATAAGGKTILARQWTQVSGPNTAVMATPNALSNAISGLIDGSYVFKLTAVDSDGISATDLITVAVDIP